MESLSNAMTLKCPACGAYLVFDPETQQFTCPFCAATYTQTEMERRAAEKTAEAQAQPAQQHMREYHCTSCGAELVTDDTTAATFCYYCHNPVTLVDRVSKEFQPDGLIPFAITREGALEKFKAFIQKRRFVKKEFFEEQELEKLSGVFYPYWIGDITGDGVYEGEGTRSSVSVTPRDNIVTTRYFRVHRTGTLKFRQMVRKALAKNDRKLSDGIHPYKFDSAKDFSTAYLSGFLAEKRDVEQQAARDEMIAEAQADAEAMMTNGLGYESLHGSAQLQVKQADMRYMLLPTWVLTYRGDQPGTTFYYMMNGQTGEVCGKLPIRWSKLLLVAGLCGLALFGALCLGGAFLW